MLKKIAILDDYQSLALSLADWSVLAPYATVEVFTTAAKDQAQLIERLKDVDVVSAMRERTAFGADVLEQLPKLKLLVSTGQRNRSIDLRACERLKIDVSAAYGPKNSSASTGEMAWALILSLVKKIEHSHQALREGHWQPKLSGSLKGHRLGLVGLGTIGQQMAKIAKAFDMEVLVWSPNMTPERASIHGVQAVSKQVLFESSDIVSVHMVLSDSTRDLVGATELHHMKPTVYVVNTSRAGLINESALLEALRVGRIAGAGLDVFWQEPLALDHPLLGLDNVVLTPHLGYASEEGIESYHQAVVQRILRWFETGEVIPLKG
jgi:phosphoglycerate dehydrogenase-like enzyme